MTGVIPSSAELPNLLEACAFVDQLGPMSTGEIVVASEEPLGAVFVERGKVCWAAARGLARRLTELIGAKAGLSKPTMESAYAECKARRTPLGEHLVGQGLVSADDLRFALLQHTVESLGLMCGARSHATFHARPGTGYSPRFTFGTAELLTHTGALAHREAACRAHRVLQRVFATGEWGVAFTRSRASAYPEPIAVFGASPPSATVVLRYGKWAASALDITATFTDPNALLTVSRRNGIDGRAALVAFGEGGVLITGETGELGPARILNRRAQERLSKGAARGPL